MFSTGPLAIILGSGGFVIVQAWTTATRPQRLVVANSYALFHLGYIIKVGSLANLALLSGKMQPNSQLREVLKDNAIKVLFMRVICAGWDLFSRPITINIACFRQDDIAELTLLSDHRSRLPSTQGVKHLTHAASLVIVGSHFQFT